MANIQLVSDQLEDIHSELSELRETLSDIESALGWLVVRAKNKDNQSSTEAPE